MKEGRPSLTAFFVAYARAVATSDPELSRVCQDPCAELLLPSSIARLVSGAMRDPLRARLLRRSALGMAEHMALRTHLIDEAVSRAVEAGARQLVVLGAGLDSRAHRLQQLRDTVVFEVDHPSTQDFKRAKAKQLPVLAKELRRVACDFERESFGDVLRAARFDPRERSVWIWEGVMMYLPPTVLASSLRMIAELSPAHSHLAATYLAPPPPGLRHLTTLGRAALGALSEPVHNHFTEPEMAQLLRRHGFVPRTDVSPRAIASQYAVHFPPFAYGAPTERILVAEKAA